MIVSGPEGGVASNSSSVSVVLAVVEDPTTGTIYFGGSFQSVGGMPCANIAAWVSGSSYMCLGGGGLPGVSVNALQLWGGSLYVGGSFTQPPLGKQYQGSSSASSFNNLAIWSLSSTSPGWQVPYAGGFDGPVNAFTVDSAGQLWIGGAFSGSAVVQLPTQLVSQGKVVTSTSSNPLYPPNNLLDGQQ